MHLIPVFVFIKNKHDKRKVYVCLGEISASSFSCHDGEESQKPGQKRQEGEKISSVETEMKGCPFLFPQCFMV